MKLARLGKGERGAAAVEFAFVILVLIPLVFGMIEFGRAFHAQITLSAAAREGVRVVALAPTDAAAPAEARQRTVDSAPTLEPALTVGDVTVTPVPCVVGDPVTVRAEYPFTFLTGLFADQITIVGEGVMRCGG